MHHEADGRTSVFIVQPLGDAAPETIFQSENGFGFAVDLMRKNLRIALEEARANGARLPVGALVDQFYSALQSRGGGRLVTSSLIRLLRDAPAAP